MTIKLKSYGVATKVVLVLTQPCDDSCVVIITAQESVLPIAEH